MAERRVHATETVLLSELQPHPRNYRGHPADQVEHLAQSIAEHGFYRNVVIARDGTILAGHGVVEAARKNRLRKIPVVRLDLDADDPKALKILTGDNELARLAEIDDRILTDLLREINDADEAGLLGTGYDEMMLANLVYVTRPASEINGYDAAAEWVGLPEYPHVARVRLMVSFDTEEERDEFLATIGNPTLRKKTGGTWSTWWPEREREDLSSLRFDA